MAQERIDSLIDIPAVKKEFDQVFDLLDQLGVSIKKSNEPSGAGSMAQSLSDRTRAMKELQTQTEQMIASDKKLEAQMDAVVAAAKEAANVNKEAVNSVKAYNGSLEANIKLQIAYKTQLADVKAKQKELEKSFDSATMSTKEFTDNMTVLIREEKELKAANLELNGVIRNQVKEINAAGNSLNELRAQLGQMKAAANDMDIGSQAFIDAQAAIRDLNDKIKGLEMSRGEFGRNVGNYAGSFSTAFDVLKTELGEVKIKMDLLKTQGGEGSPEFAELAKQAELLTRLTSGLNTEFKSTKAELRTMQQAATELALVWGQNNEVVKKFIAEVGEAKDSVADVADAIKLAASDTGKIDNLVNAAQGIAGAFGVAEGAAALFGGENKNLEKTFVKLQAIMTIMNGLQAVQNELKRKDSILTGIQAAAMRVYTVVVGTSTGALKAFRIALASTGVGLLVIALGMLIANFSKVKEVAYKLVPGLAAVGSVIEGIVNWVTDLVGVTSKASRELDKLAEKAEKDAKRQEEWLDINGDKYDEFTRRKIQANIDFNKKIKEINEDETKNEKQKLETIKQYREKANREIARAEEDRQKEVEKARKDEQEKIKQANDKKRQEQKKHEEDLKKDREAANKVIQSARDEIAKRALDEMGKELFELKKKYDEEIKIVEKAKGDTVVVTRNYLEAEAAIKKRYADAAKKKAEEDAKEEAEAIAKAKEEALQKQIAESDTLNAKLVTSTSLAYANEMRELNKSLSERKISIREYYEEKAKIEEKYSTAQIGAEILNIKRLIAFTADGSKERFELQKKLSELELQLDQKTTDKKIANQQKLRDMQKQLVDELKGLATDLVEGTFVKQKNAVEEQIEATEKNKAAEIDRINSSTLSEQEKADKIKIIEAKAQSDRELLERRKKQIDMQKAKFDRDAAIFNIAINTAQAISKAVAEFPLTGGMPFAAIAAAIGAVQIAAVFARPLPKFEKGTSSAPGGYAVTDEKGPEMYIEPGGKSYLGSDKGPTIRYLKPGTRVIPHDQVSKYLLQSQMSGGVEGLTATDTTAREIRGLKDIMYWQTNQLSNAYRKQKPNNVKVVVTSDWTTYIQKAVRD